MVFKRQKNGIFGGDERRISYCMNNILQTIYCTSAQSVCPVHGLQ